jgi:2-polyprenyl-3-methyl-5-hydroxy-6-metoxy-1,4-benzoquinol methylase
MTVIHVACDLCGSEMFTELYPGTVEVVDEWQKTIAVSDEDYGGLLDAEVGRYFSSSRQNAGHLRIVRCDRCGLVMSNPQDDQSTLSKIYSHLEDWVYESEEDNRRIKAHHHLRLLATNHSNPGSLLDIGCATGIFIKEAQAVGWQVVGLEPSSWAVNRARQRMPAVQINQGLVEDINYSIESFDVITLWDVLEHVNSPSSVLQHIYAWLKPGGLLYLNVPNIDSLIARVMGTRWVMLLREHLWYFSPTTIESMLIKNGYRLSLVQPNFVWFSPQNIFSRLSQYPGPLGSFSHHLASVQALTRPSLRFPIGEMLVVAQK